MSPKIAKIELVPDTPADLAQAVDGDTAGVVYANRFSAPFSGSPATAHLSSSFNAGAGTTTIGQAMLWDYDKGSVYFTTTGNLLVRGTLY